MSGSVVKNPGDTWNYTSPRTEVAPGVFVQVTLTLIKEQGDPTVDGSEWVYWTGSRGQTFMYTIALLEVNYANGVITGVGNCNSFNHVCSGGYVSNGYALCSGPTSLISGQGGTIAYEQENMGGASGFIVAHGIASYPEAHYNPNQNSWSFRNPAGSQWTFGGTQCSGWSFPFPSP